MKWIALALCLCSVSLADGPETLVYGVPFSVEQMHQMSKVGIDEGFHGSQEIDVHRENGGILFSSRVTDGQLMEVSYKLSKSDLEGPRSKKRRWKNHPAILFSLEKYEGEGLHRSHGMPKSHAPKEEGAKTDTTLNCFAGYPQVNQIDIRSVERYIESVAPCSVKVEAQYDGKGRFVDGCEVPDAFVYTIVSERVQSRFFIPNVPG